MGRPKTKLLLAEEVRQELKRRFQKAQTTHERVRLQSVLLATKGQHTLAGIAEIVGYARSGVQQFLERFGTGDFEALLARKKAKGKESPLQDPAVQEAIRAGLQAGRWRTAKQLAGWLKEEHQIERAAQTLYYWLGKLAGVLKVPRPVHLKKDPAQGRAFQEHLLENLRALALPKGRPVKVWITDEMRHGLKPVVRRCWSLRGERVVQVQHPRFAWGYTWAALECVSGQSEILFTNSVNLETSHKFLEQLAASAPDAEHVVIWDGAGFHPRAGNPALPARIHVLLLPPYSPELNPVEKLWDQVKDAICNQLFPSLPALEDALQTALHPFREATRVLSLLGGGWLHAQANASSPSILP
jgi:transposase